MSSGCNEIGYGEGIRSEEDWGVFTGFGEGIRNEENWGF